MYPTKKELNERWWHRLAKVIFVIVSFFVFIFSGFLFYLLEEENAQEYKVIKNFAEYLEENKSDEIITKYHGRIFSTQSFLEQNDLKNHSLGCLRDDGKVEWLSDYLFKGDIVCDQETGVICTIPENICNGDASRIVKYESNIEYSLENYVSIVIKALLTLILWSLLFYIVYYKGFLYVIFGSKKVH